MNIIPDKCPLCNGNWTFVVTPEPSKNRYQCPNPTCCGLEFSFANEPYMAHSGGVSVLLGDYSFWYRPGSNEGEMFILTGESDRVLPIGTRIAQGLRIIKRMNIVFESLDEMISWCRSSVDHFMFL